MRKGQKYILSNNTSFILHYLSFVINWKQDENNSPSTRNTDIYMVRARFMVFNTTFNNISAISWRSALLVAETRVPGENPLPAASHRQTLTHNDHIYKII